MILENRSDLREQLYRCSKCGYCRDTISEELGFYHVCPVYENLRLEQYCGRGRMTAALGIVEGVLPLSEPLTKTVYTCLSCGACKAICPERIDVCDMTRNLREEIFKRDLQPSKFKTLYSALREEHNLFGEKRSRSAWAEDLKLPQKGSTVYFVGCSTSYTYPETARACAKVLQACHKQIAYLGEDEWCCGAPAIWSGNTELFKEIVQHNVSAIESSGAKEVIISCAVCFNMMRTYYPTFARVSFKVRHVSEVLAQALRQNDIKFTKPIPLRLTYHDPCHLGRGEGIYEEPRTVITRLAGVEFSEMQRNRRGAWCCGEGVVVRMLFPNLTRKISAKRLEEAKRVGAQVIVTSCPGCVATLSKAAAWMKSKDGLDIRVYELPIIVAKAMGITP